VEVEELLRACQEADDPLEIVNHFMRMPAAGVRKSPEEYWVKRVCILAEEIVRQRLKAQLAVKDLEMLARRIGSSISARNKKLHLASVKRIAAEWNATPDLCRGCKNERGKK